MSASQTDLWSGPVGQSSVRNALAYDTILRPLGQEALGYEALPAEAALVRFTGEKIEILDSDGSVIPPATVQRTLSSGVV